MIKANTTFIGQYERIEQQSAQTAIGRLCSQQLFYLHLIPTEETLAKELHLKSKLLLSLSHPNILSIPKCFTFNNQLVIVEEHSPKKLGQLFQEGSMHLRDVAIGLATGLHYLHTVKRFVLETLSIESLFVTGGVVKISVIPQSQVIDKQSNWNAPEWQKGMYGYESDIWALGILLLELTNNNASLQRHIPLEEYLLNITDTCLRELIGSMLCSDMRERPQTHEIIQKLAGQQVTPKVQENRAVVKRLLNKVLDYWYFRITKTKLKSIEETCINQVRQEAEKGDPDALFLLGRMHCQGTGYPIDKVLGRKIFEEAESKGSTLALCNLFLLEKDNQLAKVYLEKGLEVKDDRCTWYLARACGYGWYGYEKDLARGLDLIVTIVSPDSKYELGRMTANNLGYQSSFPHELKGIYREGAEMGHRKAVEAMGQCLYQQSANKSALHHYLMATGMEGECIADLCDLQNSNGACLLKLRDRLNSKTWLIEAKQLGSKEATDNMVKQLLF